MLKGCIPLHGKPVLMLWGVTCQMGSRHPTHVKVFCFNLSWTAGQVSTQFT